MTFDTLKLLGALAEPGNLLVGLLVLGVLCWASSSERLQGWGKPLTLFIALVFLVLNIFPVGNWLLLPLENRFAPELPAKVDGIIMVAGDENPYVSDHRSMMTLNRTASRYMAVARLAEKYPKARIIHSGTTNQYFPHVKTKTSDLARQAFADLGIDANRISYEDKSFTTHENAKFSHERFKPKEGETWLLVTSAFHLPRTYLCFEKFGWKTIPYPSDYLTTGEFEWRSRTALDSKLNSLYLAFHEYEGLISYWLMGWTDRIWP